MIKKYKPELNSTRFLSMFSCIVIESVYKRSLILYEYSCIIGIGTATTCSLKLTDLDDFLFAVDDDKSATDWGLGEYDLRYR